jgi:hypothetical protein
VIRPQAGGLYATTFVATSCQASRAMCHVTCGVLCYSVALLLYTLCGYRAGRILISLLSIVVGYDMEGRFVWFSDMMLADSHVQSRAIVLTCLGLLSCSGCKEGT